MSKINYIEYEMGDGEFITMSTAPILLLRLRNKNKKVYEDVSKVLVSGPEKKDIAEMFNFLYGAYVCANQDEENIMTFNEFIERNAGDYQYDAEKINEMIRPRKKQDSEQPSEEL